MGHKFFGTDGIRGPYGGDLISEAFASHLARGMVEYLRREKAVASPHVIIGRDPRYSGKALQNAFAEAFMQAGGTVSLLGIVPTPVVAFAVRHYGAALGLAITASHNPSSDNGFKFFDEKGSKFSKQA